MHEGIINVECMFIYCACVSVMCEGKHELHLYVFVHVIYAEVTLHYLHLGFSIVLRNSNFALCVLVFTFPNFGYTRTLYLCILVVVASPFRLFW